MRHQDALILSAGPAPDPIPTPPYEMPTSAPWNVPNYAITPTPDGTGSGTHPSVLDFGPTGWRGFRYWMAFTPYFGSNAQIEDPSILVSKNGYYWQEVPSAVANPIFPSPPGTPYYSDTDLTYDPDNDRLIVIWRETDSGLAPGDYWVKLYASTSTDGRTWSAPVTLVHLTGLSTASRLLSPALVRVAADDWRLFTGWGISPVEVRTATNPLSTSWAGPSATTFSGPTHNLWHLDVNYAAGVFHMVGASSSWYLYTATSTNGIAWTHGNGFLFNTEDSWDTTTMYRATFTPHENGTHYRLWYSSDGPESWRIGFTQIPRSLFP